MATITPGYDFSVDEIPTYGKFIAQAQGLDITGLEFSDLVDDTSFLWNSQESNGSGATQVQDLEGGLWYDPAGDMWVTVGVYGWWGSSGYSGPDLVQVPIFKPRQGGWSTIRGNRGVDTANFGKQPLTGAGAVVAGYSPTSIRRTTNFFNQKSTGGTREGGYSIDTPASGIYFITTGRGGCRFFISSNVNTTTDLPYRWAMTTSTQYDIRDIVSPGSTPPNFAMGEIFGADPYHISSPTLDADMIAWAYGRVVAETA